MKNCYLVEIKTYSIVLAENENDASKVAEEWESDAMADGGIYEVVKQIKSVDDLGRYGWDKECIPFGEENDRRLEEILSESND